MNNKLRLNEKTIKHIKELNQLFKNLEGLYFSYSNDKAVELALYRDKIVKEIETTADKATNVKQAYVLRTFLEMIKKEMHMLEQILTIA